MKDIKPFLIALLAIGLVGTWVYHLYDKTLYTRSAGVRSGVDSTAIAIAARDSLNNELQTIQASMGTKLDSAISVSDSMQKVLDLRILEINKLKSRIASILGRRDLSRNDLDSARGLIAQLQTSVDDLREQNGTIEEQRQQLQGQFALLTATADTLQKDITRVNQENTVMRDKIALGSVFVASDIKLAAVTAKGNKERETSDASKADKLVVSFAIQNNMNPYLNEQIAIVIIQPNKQVLQKIDWNSANIETKGSGSKPFTRMIKFDYERGERKELRFSLDPEDFQKGTYALQLWHQGTLIGTATTALN